MHSALLVLTASLVPTLSFAAVVPVLNAGVGVVGNVLGVGVAAKVDVNVAADGCVYPNSAGKCGGNYRRHSTLPICIDASFDLNTDLSISAPHYLWYAKNVCGSGRKPHPTLLGICIDVDIDYNLELGSGACRPDSYQVCPRSWRRHRTIPNLCLNSNLDVDVRGLTASVQTSLGHCTAGWWAHPHVSSVCVDSAVDISLWSYQCAPRSDGTCPVGYRRHALLELCLPLRQSLLQLGLDVTLATQLGVDGIAGDNLQVGSRLNLTAAVNL